MSSATPTSASTLDLARAVCAGLTAPGRPLYAAHAGLAWPDEPRLALWHAATLIREHRGDGHVAALLRAGLDPVESIVIGGLFSGSTGFMRSSRGWSDEEWAAGVERLTERGLVDGDGLTEHGLAFRKDLERETDRMALEGWAHLGLDGTRRVAEARGAAAGGRARERHPPPLDQAPAADADPRRRTAKTIRSEASRRRRIGS